MNTSKVQAWTAMNKLSRIRKASQISRRLELCVFRTTVEATIIYSSQWWTLTAAQECSLDEAYTRLLHKALNISYNDHVPSIIPRLHDPANFQQMYSKYTC